MADTTFTSGTVVTSDWLNAIDDIIYPTASNTPTVNGQLVFELTSDTSLKIKVKGSDGTVRSVTLTLA
jgi:hypothetical protein